VPYSALNSNYWRLNFENPSIGCRVMWPQHSDIQTYIHTYRHTDIHTYRQTDGTKIWYRCAFSTQNHLYGKKYILSWIMLIFLYNSFYFILFKYMHWIHNIFNISIALLLSLKYINWVWDFKSWSSKKDTFLHLSNFPFYLFFSLPKLEWSVTL